MNILDTIRERYSCRRFKDLPVSRRLIEEILDAARWSASGANTQPWEIAVVMGKSRERLIKIFMDNIDISTPPRQEFDYYPERWKEPYKTRRFRCGIALYDALKIKREDKEARAKQWLENYRFFNAPVGIFFFIDKGLGCGAVLDTGIFVQSVMISARAFGLETCAQAALSYYPDLVKGFLGIDKTKLLLCGMSMGYPDKDAKVNSYRTDREPVSSFTRWYE